jgi:Tfp pilus assembly protein PilF
MAQLNLLSIITLALLLSGCSLPKIIVLHDPLSANEHLQLGSIYGSQGKTGLARDQYREAVRQDPTSARAWSLLGDTAYKMNEYGEAEKAYRKAIDLDPKSGDLRNNLAWVYVEQGQDLDTALELVMKALELSPEHRPYYLDTLGVVLLKLGKPREAITALKESAEAIPKDQAGFLAEAYGHLSEAYRAAGDEAAAQETSAKRELLLEKK